MRYSFRLMGICFIFLLVGTLSVWHRIGYSLETKIKTIDGISQEITQAKNSLKLGYARFSADERAYFEEQVKDA